MGLKKRGRKNKDRRLILITSIFLILALFFLFYQLKIKVPIFKAPPSFHEIYGTITCSNSASLEGKIINISVTTQSGIYSNTGVISNNFYDLLAQGFSNTDSIIMSIENQIITNLTFTPFGYQELNITTANSNICILPQPSGGGSGGSGGSGSGGGDSGGGSGGSITPLTGSINVTSTPSGANVFLNGIFKGITPLILKNVASGTYTINIVKENYQNMTRTLNLGSGESKKLDVSLQQESRIELPKPIDFYKITSNQKMIVSLILIGLLVLVFVFSFIHLKKRKQ